MKKYQIFLGALFVILLVALIFSYRQNSYSMLDTFTSNVDSCTHLLTSAIPPGSVVVIGHAYGTPGGKGEFIAPKVETFIRKHADSLESVIFSGDVIATPSAQKWLQLERLSKETGVDFLIAPGNHDVGSGKSSARRDVWNAGPYSLSSRNVKKIRSAGFSILLEDSIISGWQMSSEVLSALNEFDSNLPKIIIRHNIAIEEMQVLANSLAGLEGKLPDLTSLSEKLLSETTVISGDSGAFSSLPRLSCFGNDRVKFISTGIGETMGDVVLVLAKGRIYRMPI